MKEDTKETESGLMKFLTLSHDLRTQSIIKTNEFLLKNEDVEFKTFGELMDKIPFTLEELTILLTIRVIEIVSSENGNTLMSNCRFLDSYHLFFIDKIINSK